jgi:hypothetical protein
MPVTCILQFPDDISLTLLPGAGGNGMGCRFGWPETEAVMMFGGDDDHLHSGITEHPDPLVCIK